MIAPHAGILVLKTACVCLLAFIILMLEHFFARVAYAAEACEYTVAQVVSIQGAVELRRKQAATQQPADLSDTLCAGDSLHVQKNSRAAIRLANESTVRLDENTDITFPEAEENKVPSLMDLHKGAIHVISRASDPFKIITPYVSTEAVGTEFFIGIDEEEEKTRVILFEGRISISNDQGSLTLNGQEAALVYQHKSPQKEVIIHSTDAVQWALHYPTIIDNLLDPPSQDGQSANFLIHQAGHLLTIGRVDEATTNIEQVLTLEPDNSDAYALQAIIAVVQNDKDQALNFATQAVELDPTSATAKLALSYAQQAHFDIEDALATVHEAVKLDSQNALAWARLAELQMSVGQLDRALDAAQQAVSLNPDIAKTRTVLGFAYLLQINTENAKTVFNEAILLDQADPMPRLGLGLALIREGKLEAGRIELEIAVSLDPANSLIRSYLGKAYFEEDRYSLATTQFNLAKALDPNDPTPWLYDAIQKQTQNLPVEALKDIQKSIELNDNRAVYRSGLLLDQDEAARGTSLARIYDNLSFEKRAVVEAARSLSLDPANHSAHRFLSDAYIKMPLHTAARASELLQTQLLQPININPVQPPLAVDDFNILTETGVTTTGFNEFTPLMERNKSQFITSGIVGSNSTLGDEIVFSKLHDKTSFSLGQYHFQTEGFRSNNNQKHTIVNAFIQHAFTPKLNVQAEFRTRVSEIGDLLLDFNPDIFLQNRRKLQQNTLRLGGRYEFSPSQNLIFSGKYIDSDENTFIDETFGFIDGFIESSGFQFEVQHLLRKRYFNSVFGGGVYRFDINIKGKSTSNIDNITTKLKPEEQENIYLYTQLSYWQNLNLTLGLSYDSFRNSLTGAKEDKINPKFGVQWNILENLRLRAAWFETTKSYSFAQQTIEPTQVAGFNQIFDDLDNTRTRRMGVGLDYHASHTLYGGVEISKRTLGAPQNETASSTFLQKQNERLYRAYLNWAPHPHWATKGEFQFEKYSRDFSIFLDDPSRIQTLSIPVSVEYFHPSGFFSGLTGTYVEQDLIRFGDINMERDPRSTNSGVDDFFMLDAVIGYRLPKRKGVLSFEGRNLLDQQFFYRNFNLQTINTANLNFSPTRTYIPERTLFVRLTWNF